MSWFSMCVSATISGNIPRAGQSHPDRDPRQQSRRLVTGAWQHRYQCPATDSLAARLFKLTESDGRWLGLGRVGGMKGYSLPAGYIEALKIMPTAPSSSRLIILATADEGKFHERRPGAGRQ